MTNIAIILDIDTTIANNDHRASLLQRECLSCLTQWVPDSPHCSVCGSGDSRVPQKLWDRFLDPRLVALDEPVQKAQEAISALRGHGIPFHYVTGRSEALRGVTEQWLKQHFEFNPTESELMMRQRSHEGLVASRSKEQSLLNLIRKRNLEGYKFFFMEDDPHVFRMYRKYGIVIQCPEGWDSWVPEPANGVEEPFTR